MSKILAGFCPAAVQQKIELSYQKFRLEGSDVVSAFCGILYNLIAWIFLPLEKNNWHWILANRRSLFPHISSNSPRFADPLRYLIQSLWLVLIKPVSPRSHFFKDHFHRTCRWINAGFESYYHWLEKVSSHSRIRNIEPFLEKFATGRKPILQKTLLSLLSFCLAFLALLCITQPFPLLGQLIFVLLLWLIAVSIQKIPGRIPVIILVVLSLIVSSRYMWWRYTATIPWEHPLTLFFALLLLLAETYSWIVLVLGYFQTVWPLNRNPLPLPADISSWPTVDIMITTYNEELSIVMPTVYAALGLDWPKDKLAIYLLDDGNRPEFKQFADKVGIHYIARPTHESAKAGNLNYALQFSQGELVAIFDCDHITTHSFLQLTVGWFMRDPKIALLQTPHHFFSPDPFERNLGHFRKTPNEGILFYGLIQNGNDTWNATFFCGSCGILRRSALATIGGMATETVTEDAHTSLRLQRQGFKSAYIRIPLAAGLATDNLAIHLRQRVRWARGMVQILRLDNPMLGKGLTLPQRLCYLSAVLHFLSGIPRLIFLVAPLIFLVFHGSIIYAPALMIILYAIPHLAHVQLTNNRIQGKFRHFLWSDIYETVLAWYIALPTLMVLINPHSGKFNVTLKGKTTETEQVDWLTMRPYLILTGLNFIGLLLGGWRLFMGPWSEIGTVMISLGWVGYNFLLLGGTLAVAIESRQRRQSNRVEITMPAALAAADGHVFSCTVRDYADNSVGIEMPYPDLLQAGDRVNLLLTHDQQEYSFPCEVMRALDQRAGLKLHGASVQQHIDFIQCTFARADTWALWQNNFPTVNIWESLTDTMKMSWHTYLKLAKKTPHLLGSLLLLLGGLMKWLGSFFPRPIIRNAVLE